MEIVNVAVLMTVYNRVEKTLLCLKSLWNSLDYCKDVKITVFITDDQSTDGTRHRIKEEFPYPNIIILQGDGNLFWNGGMINSWKAALSGGGYDGYLWLNNDTEVLPNLWKELLDADRYSKQNFKMGGIYIGSTYDKDTGVFTYGGFNFIGRWKLKDEFLHPNGKFQKCQCSHGNITYVSHNVVEKRGILCEKYMHGGGDHDYTYLAYRNGFPLLVLRDYVGICKNDHKMEGFGDFMDLKLSDRLKFLNSPVGFNLKNTLLFQKRCFPYRYPFVWIMSYIKILFPKSYFRIYKFIRK